MTLRPPRRPFSVSRQLSERARAAATARAAAAQPQDQAGVGINIAGLDGVAGMVGALRGLVEQLAATAQQAAAADPTASEPGADEHGRTFSVGGGKARMVFGYTLKMGADGISAEPFGDVPARKTERAGGNREAADKEAGAVPAALQPIVEVYQDGATVVVIAELPGADPDRIVCRADGVRLLIEAAGARNYRKDLTLPVPVRSDSVAQSLRNGILEVRLVQADAP